MTLTSLLALIRPCTEASAEIVSPSLKVEQEDAGKLRGQGSTECPAGLFLQVEE